MSVYRRGKAGKVWYVEHRWRGYPRLRLSTGSTVKARALEMERTVAKLRDNGRRDIVDLLATGRLNLEDVHEAYEKSPDALLRLTAEESSPKLGGLLDDWFAWMYSPSGISPHTDRRYAPNTIRRYEMSWQKLLRAFPEGREAQLKDVTKGFVAEFRQQCAGEHAEPATVNRDLCALMAFLRWCAEERELTAPVFKIKREREPAGRERWLSAAEIAAVRKEVAPEWWSLFATLIYTGLRVGEAQGLRWRDVDLAERRVAVHEGDRRIKTRSSDRDVPIPQPLLETVVAHQRSVPHGPADPVFPGVLGDYRAARRTWRTACLKAQLHDGGKRPKPNATIHDLRHTFGVHAAKAGVPIARLQKLMGHGTPVMTMRYMKHAPHEFFGEDAGRIAASMELKEAKTGKPASAVW